MAVFCEMCLENAYEEGIGEEELEEVLLNFGDQICDHCCERIEVGPEVKCDCACVRGNV